MTGRHKLFATGKNQVSMAPSLTLAAAAVEAAARTGGLFELSVCPSMTAPAPVARVRANTVAVTAQNRGRDDSRSLTGEPSCTPDEAAARHRFIRSVVVDEQGGDRDVADLAQLLDQDDPA